VAVASLKWVVNSLVVEKGRDAVAGARTRHSAERPSAKDYRLFTTMRRSPARWRRPAGIADHLAPREPHHPPARGGQQAVTPAILFERLAVAVGLPAVELDRKPQRRPGEVDAEAVARHLDPCVDGRAPQAGLCEQRERSSLELAVGPLEFDRDHRQGGAKGADTGAVGCPPQQLVDRTWIESGAPLRCRERGVERVRIDRGQTKQGAWDARAGDPVDVLTIALGQ